jgi:hypothetical protein
LARAIIGRTPNESASLNKRFIQEKLKHQF